jgi:regulator of protease activity HflC (stomatin/prohibitin superfamily)
MRGGGISALVIIIVIAAIALVAVMSAVTTIQSGTRGVLRTFGEITNILDEGLHFRPPFITEVTVVDVKTQRYESTSSAASRDLQIVSTQIVLNYRPDATAVDALIRDVGIDYENRIIDPAVQEALKAATAQFTAEELITRRPDVSQAIQDVLRERLSDQGIVIEAVSITDFNFSDEFANAIEAKQVAEQDALRAERELRRAQIEAQQQVARAEAEAESRLQIAQAEAEALRLQREVISPELLQLRFIERWNGVLPRFMGGEGGLGTLLTVPEAEFAAADEPVTPPTTAPEPTPTPSPTATPEPELEPTPEP